MATMPYKIFKRTVLYDLAVDKFPPPDVLRHMYNRLVEASQLEVNPYVSERKK